MDHVAWQEANEALDTVHQISQILDTGLDKETLNILIALCEAGVNPEVATHHTLSCSARFDGQSVTMLLQALAAVVRELRREAARLKLEQTKIKQ